MTNEELLTVQEAMSSLVDPEQPTSPLGEIEPTEDEVSYAERRADEAAGYNTSTAAWHEAYDAALLEIMRRRT